jgi:sec-independent protein translocase protein TatC
LEGSAMAESEDKDADKPTPPEDAKAPEQADPPREQTQGGSDRDEYGQYEEDWQEAEARAEPSDSDDYWADGEQQESEGGGDHGVRPEYQGDENENEYQDEQEQDDQEDEDEEEGDHDEDDEDEDEYEDEYEDEEDDEEEEEDEVGQRKMTLVEHLDELRTRIIRALIGLAVGMAIALAVCKSALDVINGPYERATGLTLKAIDMMSPFTVYMQISLYLGLLISSPWVFYQIWMFIAAGLYKHERKYVVYAVPFSAILFITGSLFFLFYISPMLLGAFNLFNTWLNVESNVTIENNVDFMTNMMLVFGFCFQMPIAVLLLGKMGLVTVKTLGKYRKFVIVAILILAALVTSPSPLDQIALAIPMWLLYEVGVLLVYLLVEKKRRAEDAAMGYKPLDD